MGIYASSIKPVRFGAVIGDNDVSGNGVDQFTPWVSLRSNGQGIEAQLSFIEPDHPVVGLILPNIDDLSLGIVSIVRQGGGSANNWNAVVQFARSTDTSVVEEIGPFLIWEANSTTRDFRYLFPRPFGQDFLDTATGATLSDTFQARLKVWTDSDLQNNADIVGTVQLVNDGKSRGYERQPGAYRGRRGNLVSRRGL